MTASIIFGLLVVLMLTGMPISIALGLTVLLFLFTMTTVPIDTVALKLFTAVIGTMGLRFVMELYATDQVTADLEAPRWIVFSAIPAGSYLMCFRFLQVAFAFWKTGELPHHDESRVEGIEIDAPPTQSPASSSSAGAAR